MTIVLFTFSFLQPAGSIKTTAMQSESCDWVMLHAMRPSVEGQASGPQLP